MRYSIALDSHLPLSFPESVVVALSLRWDTNNVRGRGGQGRTEVYGLSSGVLSGPAASAQKLLLELRGPVSRCQAHL